MKKCCFKGAHLTLNLSIESTLLLHHYAARPGPKTSFCTTVAGVYVVQHVEHKQQSTDVCMWPAYQHSMAMGKGSNGG
jgi:hypothetical protein